VVAVDDSSRASSTDTGLELCCALHSRRAEPDDGEDDPATEPQPAAALCCHAVVSALPAGAALLGAEAEQQERVVLRPQVRRLVPQRRPGRGAGGIASRPISLATMQGLLPPTSGGTGEEAVVSAAAQEAERGAGGRAIHSLGGWSGGSLGRVVEGRCLLGFELNWRWSESSRTEMEETEYRL
jgi:hypothetical protein